MCGESVKRVGCFEYLNVARDYDWALGLACRVDDDFNNGVYMMFCVMRGSIMTRLEGTGWGLGGEVIEGRVLYIPASTLDVVEEMKEKGGKIGTRERCKIIDWMHGIL
jgi:hypothetical protein